MASQAVPMGPRLVVLDPDGKTEEGRTTLLDPKGDRVMCDIESLGSRMSFALTWKGWILLLSWDRNDFHTFLYDPMTWDKIELPNFAHHHFPRVFQCALSDKPTNHGCVVVILHPYEPCLWYCRVGGPGEWIKYDYDVGSYQCDTKGLDWEKIVISNLTSCKSKFYFPISNVEHGIIEFNPSPVTRVVTMRGMPRGYDAHACFFELDEEPYQFFAFQEGASGIAGITLYKIDLVKQRFIEVDEIGDRALLWSGHGGGCCPATEFALEPNCVYWIRPAHNSMHICNIVENTQRVCCHSSEDLPKLSSRAFLLLPSS